MVMIAAPFTFLLHLRYHSTMLANFTAVISHFEIREGSQTFASSAISKASAWLIFVLLNRAELVLRELQSIYLSLIGQSASTCRAGWILRTLGFCGWFIRSCVKRHSICLPSLFFSLSLSLFAPTVRLMQDTRCNGMRGRKDGELSFFSDGTIKYGMY